MKDIKNSELEDILVTSASDAFHKISTIDCQVLYQNYIVRYTIIENVL